MDIKSLLQSKSHNPNYLNRYIRYIEACKKQNKSLPKDAYTEEHHICPKAKDLFPEYSDLNMYKWNSVQLTARQHVWAHIILWKLYGGSQATSVHYFLNVQNSDYIKKSKRKIPLNIKVRYAADVREESRLYRRGTAVYKDSSGRTYLLKTDDNLIKELNLVGQMKGTTKTKEQRQKLVDVKMPNKVVHLYMLGNEVTVKLFSEEYVSYISQGWEHNKSEEDKEYTRKEADKKNSEFWTGRARYATPDGEYHGSYLKGDPIIKELGLIKYSTDKQWEQRRNRLELATEAKLGTNIWTNGTEERFSKDSPGEGWRIGRAERSEEWESKRTKAVTEKCKGAKIYTNGQLNMWVQEGDEIPEGYYQGMKKRPGKTYYYTNKEKSVLLEFVGNHEEPEGFKRMRYIKDALALKDKLG